MKIIITASLFLAAISILPSCTKTPGSSCGSPGGLTATSITSSSALIKWQPGSTSISYNVQYRQVGTSTWTSNLVTEDSLPLSGLTASTNYEWQVQQLCTTGLSGFTGSSTFKTGDNNVLYATFRGATHAFAVSGGMIGYNSANANTIMGIESSTHDTIGIDQNGLLGGTSTFGTTAADQSTLLIAGARYQTSNRGRETYTISTSSASMIFYTTVFNVANASDSIVITNGNFGGGYSTQ
jgi:hypothetical protein